MRKLNSKNKLLILGLSIFTFLVLSAVCVFIIFKIKDYNVKYDVSSISYLYNKDKELITVKNNSYIKKDFIGNYYLYIINYNTFFFLDNVIASTKHVIFRHTLPFWNGQAAFSVLRRLTLRPPERAAART